MFGFSKKPTPIVVRITGENNLRLRKLYDEVIKQAPANNTVKAELSDIAKQIISDKGVIKENGRYSMDWDFDSSHSEVKITCIKTGESCALPTP